MQKINNIIVKILKFLSRPNLIVFWVAVYIGLTTNMLKPVLTRTTMDEYAKLKRKLCSLFKRKTF